MFEVKASECKIVNSHQSHATPQPTWKTITVPDIPHEAILASALLTTEADLEPRIHRQARTCPDTEK